MSIALSVNTQNNHGTIYVTDGMFCMNRTTSVPKSNTFLIRFPIMFSVYFYNGGIISEYNRLASLIP